MSINVRIKKFTNKDGSTREYLYLVENLRVNGKNKQKNLACLGRLDELNKTDQISRLTKALAKFSKDLLVLKARDELSAEWAKQYGPLPIFRHIWNNLGLGSLLSKYEQKHNYKFKASETIFSMVCNHLMDPRSERGTYEWKQNIYEPKWDNLQLHHYYRALDFLVEHKEEMESDIMERVVDLFNQDLDLIMFDTTTIMNWGNGECAPLLEHGYSKDKRGDLKQIMIGLLMTKDGYPIGHEVFKGNLGDINAFKETINKLQERFKIKRAILVCDRGMICKKNIDLLKELGLEYILGLRMRKLDKDSRDILLKKEDFEIINPAKLWVKDHRVEDNDRYIVCYNPESASEEKIKREYFKKHLEGKAEKNTIKDWIIKNGYKKYIKIEDAKISIDEEKLKQEEIYDGMWILRTNTNLPTEEIAKYYKDLSQIEQCFRELKNQLEIGPIYHWKDRRIRAHVFIGFLSLILKVTLKKAIHKINPDVLYCDVMDRVKEIKALKLNLNNTKVILRTEFPEGAYIAYQAIGLRPPGRFLTDDDINNTEDYDKNVMATPDFMSNKSLYQAFLNF